MRSKTLFRLLFLAPLVVPLFAAADTSKAYPNWDSTKPWDTQLEWARSADCAAQGLKYDWARPVDHPEACIAPVPPT